MSSLSSWNVVITWPTIFYGIWCGYRYVRVQHFSIIFFAVFRRSATKDPTSRNKDTAESRQGFSYVVAGGLGVVGAYSAKAVVNTFISSWAPSQVPYTVWRCCGSGSVRSKTFWPGGSLSGIIVCIRFFALGFLHESSSPKRLKVKLGSLRIFSKIREDVRKSRCPTVIKDPPNFAIIT